MLVDSLVLGDCVLVWVGEIIFGDGIILNGFSVVNEVMLIGEFILVSKSIGDIVVGGIFNVEYLIRLWIDKNLKDSILFVLKCLF